jgi:flagellar basal body L-ring protein FlgH
MKKLCGIFVLSFLLGGCASSFRSISKMIGLGGEEKPVMRMPAAEIDNTALSEQELMKVESGASSSGNPNLPAGEFVAQQKLFDDRAQRGYRRNVDPWTATGNYNEGSLWNSDSQDNYLFTRNTLYKVGDFIMIKLEADLQESLNSKLTALYKPVGTKPGLKDTIADEAGKAAAAKVGDAVGKAVGNKNIGDAAGADVQDRTVAAFTEKLRYFTTREVPVRITEISGRGNIKVAGVKKLFLRAAAFDLKIEGMLREEDVGPSRLVASSRLMDSKVEIVK